MMPLGHMGVGNLLAAPFRRGLRKRWVLLGTLVPDLIDKPLYYGLAWSTGKRGAELGLICGTRTFGHTALLLICLTTFAFARKSRVTAALALGMATHLLLDGIFDNWGMHFAFGPPALLWPFTGWQFPIMPFQSITDHLSSFTYPVSLGGEVVGALLLFWENWKYQHHAEIFEFFRQRRLTRKLNRARH